MNEHNVSSLSNASNHFRDPLQRRSEPLPAASTSSIAVLPTTLSSKAELPLVLYGVPLDGLPQRARVLIGVLGTLGVYVVHGYLQEWLFSEPGFVYSLFVTLMQFLMFATFSRIDIAFQRWKRRRSARAPTDGSVLQLRASATQYAVPAYVYGVMGALLVLAFGLSNMSMLYLTYPMKTVLKASKLIPTMALGLVVQQRRYSSRDYISATALIVGVVLFTLGDQSAAATTVTPASSLASSHHRLSSINATPTAIQPTPFAPLLASLSSDDDDKELVKNDTNDGEYDADDKDEDGDEPQENDDAFDDLVANVGNDSLHAFARRNNLQRSSSSGSSSGSSSNQAFRHRDANAVGRTNADNTDRNDERDERRQKSPNAIAIGCFLMLGSLMSDSLLGNLQERTLERHHCTPQHLVFYNSLVGFAILSFVTTLNGELAAAIAFCARKPMILARTIALTFVGYMGVSVYLVLVKTSGIVVATTVSTVRKFCTILLSFVLFPKPFAFEHAVGLLAVFFGIVLSSSK